MLITNFPANASTIQVAINTTASAATLIPGAGSSTRFTNEGPNTCYVAVGDNTVVAVLPTTTASTSCTQILAGSDLILASAGAYFSGITLVGSANLDVSSGDGS